MREVAKTLGLSPKQARQVSKALSELQFEVLTMVSLPREDGVNMLVEIGKLESDPHMKQGDREMKFLELLSLDVPGTEKMYLERIEEMKGDLDKKLEKILTEDQFKQYKTSAIEPLDVQELQETGGE